MIINSERKAHLEATTPPTEVVLVRLREYLETAQMPVNEMARRVRYGDSSLKMFLAGRYVQSGVSSSDVLIRRALTEFMDAHPVQPVVQTPGRLHETGNVATMRHWFEHCLEHREMAALYGPPGAQKTFVFDHLVAEHNQREIAKNGHGTRAYKVYCAQDMQPGELLRKVCRAAAIPGAATRMHMQDNLTFHLRGRKVLLVLDEAQHLPIKTLEVVRELNDEPPHLGILLAGSHRLIQLFKERAAELEQWNSRMENAVELQGITVPEAVAIVGEELGPIGTDRVKKLVDNSRQVDGYSRNKHTYISARRLFRQIQKIQADPRFTTQRKETAA